MPLDEDRKSTLVELGLRRTVCDEEERWWVVREVEAPHYDRRRTRSLLFEREEAVRRIRTYPAGWFELGDAELCALMNTR